MCMQTRYLLLGDLDHIHADCIINQSRPNENFEGMLWQLGASIPHSVTRSNLTESGHLDVGWQFDCVIITDCEQTFVTKHHKRFHSPNWIHQDSQSTDVPHTAQWMPYEDPGHDVMHTTRILSVRKAQHNYQQIVKMCEHHKLSHHSLRFRSWTLAVMPHARDCVAEGPPHTADQLLNLIT